MEYPHQNEPAVLQAWHMGLHPKECKGECRITAAGGILCCWVCGWDDVKFGSPEAPALAEPSRTKVYISGKITGIETEARFLFTLAEALLKAAGYDTVNPFTINSGYIDKSWHSCMKRDIKALCDCDAIYLLSNWNDSKGARIELEIAKHLGLSVMLENKGLHGTKAL